MRRRPVILVAAAISLLMMLAALFVPMLSDVDVSAPHLDKVLEAPSWAGGDGGLMGTDQQGRDLFLRVLHGLRTSFVVGAFGALIAALHRYLDRDARRVLRRLARLGPDAGGRGAARLSEPLAGHGGDQAGRARRSEFSRSCSG